MEEGKRDNRGRGMSTHQLTVIFSYRDPDQTLGEARQTYSFGKHDNHRRGMFTNLLTVEYPRIVNLGLT